MRLLEKREPGMRKIKIQIYVSPVDHDRLLEDSKSCGITISELVRGIVRRHYEDKDKA